jgi:hypothetical protein
MSARDMLKDMLKEVTKLKRKMVTNKEAKRDVNGYKRASNGTASVHTTRVKKIIPVSVHSRGRSMTAGFGGEERIVARNWRCVQLQKFKD